MAKLRENGICPVCSGYGHQNAERNGKLWGWAVPEWKNGRGIVEHRHSQSGRTYIHLTCGVCSGKGRTSRVDCVTFLLEHGSLDGSSQHHVGGPDAR